MKKLLMGALRPETYDASTSRCRSGPPKPYVYRLDASGGRTESATGRRGMRMWFPTYPARAGMIAAALALAACADEPTAVKGRAPGEAELAGNPDLEVRRVQLGRRLFFDRELSLHGNQSCASCHDPDWGFSGPSSQVNAHGAVFEGSVAGAFGNRRPPSAAYATFSPVLRLEGPYVGGNFWDGRATGQRLGDAAAEQAQGPFLNPAEMALRDAACVVQRVSQGRYAALWASVYGEGASAIALPSDASSLCAAAGGPLPLSEAVRAQVQVEYDNIARAIAAFEGSKHVNAFTSRFDAFLAGRAELTEQERLGLQLFNGKARCTVCHSSGGTQPLFTNFRYSNLGVPRNPENPVYAGQPGFVDYGLGAFLGAAAQQGKFKSPTLRNVDRRPQGSDVKAYMHNGVFKSLETVVHFYNTRDVLPRCETVAEPVVGENCWPAPEVAANMVTGIVGNLGLTPAEEAAVVAYMQTLSDGYFER
ncbi:MAG TPA: cytochrome c peroxidase [Longimicrobium sp.]|nr:cytochrome c peroxidase [Longimicrobium sp.]